MNRFVWDMRHPGPTTFPGMILWAASTRGPFALPGTYQVKLTAHGETRTEPFTIKRHPLVTGASDADLAARFELASAITRKVSQANEAVIRIREVKAQVADRLAQVKDVKRDARLVAAGEALQRALTAIEGEIYQYRNQSSQDPLNYPIKLNNKLAALLGVVESAEARPTAATIFQSMRLLARALLSVAAMAVTMMTAIEVATACLCSSPSKAMNAGTMTMPPPTPHSAPSNPAARPTSMARIVNFIPVWVGLHHARQVVP